MVPGVTLLIIPVNSIITYNSIKGEIDKAAVERLKHVNARAADQLRRGEPVGEFMQGCRIKAAPSDSTMPADFFLITDRDVKHDPDLEDYDRKITVASWHMINGKSYKIISGTTSPVPSRSLLACGRASCGSWPSLSA